MTSITNEAAPPPVTRPPSILNLPNALTTGRLLLSFVLFWLIAVSAWVMALLIFIVAAITDWLDGHLARKQGLTSAFGRNFDPLVDKVLTCGAFIFLLPVRGSGLEAWMVTLVVGRELVVTGLRSYFEARDVKFGADFLGKIKMVLQCGALMAILCAFALPDDWRERFLPFQHGLIWAMLAATALSGGQYLVKALAIFRAA